MEHKPEFTGETDFRELLRKPWKLFGYSYIYFLLVLTVLGISYMENLTVIGKNSLTPMVLTDSSSFVQDIPYQSARALPPVEVMKVAAPTPELLSRGKDLFMASCVSCHGDNGQGDGPASVPLNPKPRNFHNLTGWTYGSKITQLYKTLDEGVPKTGMASFNYISPLDRFALIHYVRSFATGQPVDTQQELQALDSVYHLSQGSNVSGQIPIKNAALIIERENAPVVASIAQLSKEIEGTQKGPGLVVFERVARDKERIISGLIHNNSGSLLSIDQLIRSVSANPIQLGFRAEVVQLSGSEWTALYQFMNELKARKG
jgi:mono/diheme cytochrome c family protein